MTLRNTSTWAWEFRSVDTWFFKEAKPIEAASVQSAQSLFPPTPFTLAGAVRAILKQLDVADAQLKQAFENLRLRGVYVYKDGERLYPLPASILVGKGRVSRLMPDLNYAVQTDKGLLNLPVLEDGDSAQVVEQAWLTAANFAKVLCDQPLAKNDILLPVDLYKPQSRIGIARLPQERIVAEGMLYQMEHICLRPGITLQALTSGLTSEVQAALASTAANHLVRFGGEGRMASVRARHCADDRPHILPAPAKAAFMNKKGLRIVFTTPVLYRNGYEEEERHGDWMQCKQFTYAQAYGAACWYTELQTQDARGPIRLRIVSAAQQRLRIEGTWDFKNANLQVLDALGRRSSAYLPAGTTWFCELLSQDMTTVITDSTSLFEAAQRMHGMQLGMDRVMGRGEMALGCW